MYTVKKHKNIKLTFPKVIEQKDKKSEVITLVSETKDIRVNYKQQGKEGKRREEYTIKKSTVGIYENEVRTEYGHVCSINTSLSRQCLRESLL